MGPHWAHAFISHAEPQVTKNKSTYFFHFVLLFQIISIEHNIYNAIQLNQHMLNPPSLSFFQEIIDLIGIFSFAASGLIAGLRKKLDLVGVSIVAGLTAFGGGTMRDILLDRRPFFWVEHSYWLWVILGLTILSIWFIKNKHLVYTEKMIQLPDAMGLALATILGTQIALQFDMPLVVSILLGVISGSFGGALRDIVCGEIPKLFSDNLPYAVIAFAGSGLYILLSTYVIDESTAAVISFIFIFTIRASALYQNWRLPNFGGRY